jgi:toxin ParE1/3/4
VHRVLHEIRRSPAAERDLIHIWLYTAERWDERQADLYLDQIAAALDRLRENPEIGADSSEIRQGYRRLAVGSHRIYYRVAQQDVEVIRVLHAKMDVSSHLGE